MKNQFIFCVISFVLFQYPLAANTDNLSMDTSRDPHNPAPAIEIHRWQDDYAMLLRESEGKDFLLYDIDQDGIPELLIGKTSNGTYKHSQYDMYIFVNGAVEWIGIISTLSWGYLWADNNGGVLGYDYGAGGGETYRYYIDNGLLCYDYYDPEGNQIEWFRGPEGEQIIITNNTAAQYHFQSIADSLITLDSYDITEINIATVVYGGV